YQQKGTQVNLEFARYSSRRYEDEAESSAPELDAYVKAHEADLKKQFEDRAFLYKKTDKQARLRRVAIEVAKDATPAQVEAAKKQIDQAAARVKAGASIAELAQKLSSDEHARKRGGLIGWRKKGFTGLGAPIDEKIFSATTKKGDVIGPERSPAGFELLQ